MCNKEYKIFAALHDDVSAGNVWITQDSGCKSGKRQIAKITNPTNKNTIYCECLQIDNNFLEKYNEKVKKRKVRR